MITPTSNGRETPVDLLPTELTIYDHIPLTLGRRDYFLDGCCRYVLNMVLRNEIKVVCQRKKFKSGIHCGQRNIGPSITMHQIEEQTKHIESVRCFGRPSLPHQKVICFNSMTKLITTLMLSRTVQ